MIVPSGMSPCHKISAPISNLDKACAILMAFFSNGPTLIPSIGLRSEHVSVMVFAVIALFQLRFKILSSISWCILFVSLFFFFSALNAGLFPSFIFIKEEFNVVKFFLAFTPLCYFFSCISHERRIKYFKYAMSVYFVVVSLNFALQLANAQGYALDIPVYFAGDGEEVSVLWQACYGQGRYNGVFFQPANQGLFTGLFLIAAMWIWEKQAFRWVAFVVASLSIFLGASKVGLIGILFAMMFILRNRPRYLVPLILIAIAFSGFLTWVQTTGATGLELQFLDPEKEASIKSVTAGRVGENSTLFYAISCVWTSNPIIGVGPGELSRVFSMPYDNDLVYMYANGGIFAVFAEIGAFLAILTFAKGEVKCHALFLFAFLCISSLGIVIFSGNGSVFLLSLMLSFLYAESKKTPPAPIHPSRPQF